MMRRTWLGGALLVAAAAMLAPALAEAQITRVSGNDAKQSIALNLGYFAIRGIESRPADDVLVVDLDSLAFDPHRFNGFSVGGEYLIPIGKYLEAGFGVDYTQQTVPSVYANFVNSNGSEIAQELKLRITPVVGTIRFLPIGHGSVEPYVGGGIGVFNWHYSEVGDFVDFSDNSVFFNRYSDKGNAFGGVILGGVRAPVGDVFAVGIEIKYQIAEGDIDVAQSGLLGSKIDLGGWTTNFKLHFRF